MKIKIRTIPFLWAVFLFLGCDRTGYDSEKGTKSKRNTQSPPSYEASAEYTKALDEIKLSDFNKDNYYTVDGNEALTPEQLIQHIKSNPNYLFKRNNATWSPIMLAYRIKHDTPKNKKAYKDFFNAYFSHPRLDVNVQASSTGVQETLLHVVGERLSYIFKILDGSVFEKLLQKADPKTLNRLNKYGNTPLGLFMFYATTYSAGGEQDFNDKIKEFVGLYMKHGADPTVGNPSALDRCREYKDLFSNEPLWGELVTAMENKARELGKN